MKKAKVAIIGTGNIGTDLLLKIMRSDLLECTMFIGRDSESDNIKLAKKKGINTFFNSIHAIEENPDLCDIVFDATSAKAHLHHIEVLKKLKKYSIDLTPAKVEKMCVPVINMEEAMNENGVNLITCGGQAVTPIVYTIMKVHPEIQYMEVVASISSKSAGPGTRANIDEYTQTTKDAILHFSGVSQAKAIIVLNPAEPPILMNNTIYAKIDHPNIEVLKKEIDAMAEKIREYVPGYKIILGPVSENQRLTVMVQVTGLGDFLPKYAGNLDIINCAAVKIAEEYAKRKILN